MYFFLNKPNNKISPIRLRYYIKSESKTFNYSTGISINPNNWNKENRMPKAKSGAAGFELKQITNKLNRYIEELDKSINVLESQDKQVTRQQLKKRLNARFKLTIITRYTLIDELDAFILEREKIGKLSKISINKYTNLKSKIIAFNSNIKPSEVDKDFMIDFIAFLRHEYQLTDITLNRTVGFLKTFLKWITENGVQVNKDYKKITVSTRDADHVSLTKEQVQKLSDLDLNTTLDKYRDLFLIGCYSGQRFSDYTLFKKSDVINGRIERRAVKTQYKSYIPISNKLEALLDKWEWRLPKVSNQKFNKNIKEVCKLAGFTDEITKSKFLGNQKIEEIKPLYMCIGSHTARRTFITNAANQAVPDHIIMAICGIRDPSTLKTYKKFQESELEKWTNNIF